ncbi:MAG TPA: TauD/TfdA family dioxygenase [Gammaproteobacteria bacterium]|nr:TauD/TfdA family dioxygenase [Gammaproteobacteria bacterium]
MAVQVGTARGRASGTSPFDLADDETYGRWREWKLAQYPTDSEQLTVSVAAHGAVSSGDIEAIAAIAAIAAQCRKTNLVFYDLGSAPVDRETIRALGARLGLHSLDSNLCADGDGISALQTMEGGRHAGYIPYSNKPLNWHTDGYYNSPDQTVRAILMHCVRASRSGGENAFFDHEILYILLRDRNPDYVAALMEADAMTIPANVEHGVQIRPAQAGPVFSVDPATGGLHMRYTARTRNIVWKDDQRTREAVALIGELLDADTPYRIRHRLRPGQGVISNNVLHNRTGFADGDAAEQRRLLFRARYFDRVADTGWRSTATGE